MSLPWFPFNIKAYVTDTMALTTEGHGAYLLLMLHYYATERPPRNDDRSLAAITKLPIDRWLEVRPEIEPFFVVTESVWTHQRIRDELRNGVRRHDRTVAATQAAKEARDAKKKHTTPPVTAKSIKPPSIDRDDVRNGLRDDVRAESVTTTQEQEQEHLSKKEAPLASLAGSPPDEKIGLGDTIPENWKPTPDDRLAGERVGMSPPTLDYEARCFHASKLQSCAMSPDWSASWRNWCSMWSDKQPKPKASRKTKSKQPGTPLPADWQPNDGHRALAQEHGENFEQMEKLFRAGCVAHDRRYANHDGAFTFFIINQKNYRKGNGNGSPSNGSRSGSLNESLHGKIAQLQATVDSEMPSGPIRIVSSRPV